MTRRPYGTGESGQQHAAAPDIPAARRRIVALDELRGLTIISMVAFHATYDLAYLFGVDLPWFTAGPVQSLWRISISWTFLALAGWMTSCSRNNLRRAAIYAGCAVLVWAATEIAAVDTPISFGIIFCMAASTAIWAAFERACPRVLDAAPRGAALVCLVLFLVTQGVPHLRYEVAGFAWLGFPSLTFASGDYYPLIPYAFLYLAAAFMARWRGAVPYPAWMYRSHISALSVVGRFSLPIYLVHQPILLVACEMLAAMG